MLYLSCLIITYFMGGKINYEFTNLYNVRRNTTLLDALKVVGHFGIDRKRVKTSIPIARASPKIITL